MLLPPNATAATMWLMLFVAFLIANRAAYQGFFSDDDLDNMANAHQAGLADYAVPMLKPSLAENATFRPVAHFYYYVMVRLAGVRFTPYIAGIQFLHLLNVVLIFLLARALGASSIGAGAAALLFAFHAAAVAVYWKPMYVFDLLCATFSLLTIRTYVNGRLAVSLVCFWLALKSKEVAVLLPLVLAAYEIIFEKHRWKRLAPFFAISGVLGLQALFLNAHRDNDYSLRFTTAAIGTCARFYASKLVLGPAWLGFAVVALLLVFFRNRLFRFGVATFVTLLLLMLVLPGRLFGAYLYVPLIGLAIAISSVTRPVWLAAFFVLWIPWNYRQLRIERKVELASANERRAWFQPVAGYVRSHQETETFVYDGHPESLAPYGITGALSVLRPPEATTIAVAADSPQSRQALAQPHVAVLAWDAPSHTVRVLPRLGDQSYIHLTAVAPIWQLGEGWIDYGNGFHWIGPHAVARLLRPPNARTFEVVVYVPQIYIDGVGRGQLNITVDRTLVGQGILDKPAPTTFRFDVPEGPAGPVEVQFDVSPPLKDPGGSSKLYGAPIAAFGFVE